MGRVIGPSVAQCAPMGPELLNDLAAGSSVDAPVNVATSAAPRDLRASGPYIAIVDVNHFITAYGRTFAVIENEFTCIILSQLRVGNGYRFPDGEISACRFKGTRRELTIWSEGLVFFGNHIF